MAFGYVSDYVHSSSVFNKINTCTWHHCFLVAVEQIYNCNYSSPGWFSSTLCVMQDISLHYFYYLSNLLLNSSGDGASITSITTLPMLNSLSNVIPSCLAMNGLGCTTCSFRLYSLVWSLSQCLKPPLWRCLQCYQGLLCNLFHPQAYELGSCPIFLPLMWLFFTLSWNLYCVCSALCSSQMHKPETLVV